MRMNCNVTCGLCVVVDFPFFLRLEVVRFELCCTSANTVVSAMTFFRKNVWGGVLSSFVDALTRCSLTRSECVHGL